MDKLEQRLREDASRINVRVTDEFDERLRASLENAGPQASEVRVTRAARSWPMWWASSLTGIAATLLVIVVVNQRAPETQATIVDTRAPDDPPGILEDPPVPPVLRAEAAVLTAPLEQELENLEADLKKAEQAVREEMPFSF